MAPDTADIESRIADVIQEVLRVNRDAIKPESRIREDLGADSLDTVTLLMALEDAFKESISDEDAEGLVTVADVVTFVKARAGAQGA
ncbi:MAG: acyl carrier protein [Chitinivibrionales bacterium]|nr:acyl carrier protein [Chitinivibrionales bacterium]